MADTLTNINTDAKVWANDTGLDLTTATDLRIANDIYQGMFSPEYEIAGIRIGRRWPEATREDTSLTMVVGTEQYTWPATPDFKFPCFIEGLDTNNSNEPYPVMWAPDMATWSAWDQSTNAQPVYCRLIDVAGVVKLALRPNPDQTDGIRITGQIEVTEFTTGASLTIFLQKSSDRALARLIAAYYRAKRGDTQRAIELVHEANALLPKSDLTPSLVGTGRVRPWGGESGGRTARWAW